MTLTSSQLTTPLKVIKRIQETPEAVSLVLEIPESMREKFKYEAGQFVTFFLPINGQELHRSYSLSSAPGVDTQFQVTVKKVAGGLGSTHLCEQIRTGDVLKTTPPAGHFFKLRNDSRHYFLFAAGSGITPLFSILKRVLTQNDQNCVTLLYGNRNEDSIIFADELKQWQTRFPERLQVFHAIKNPSPSWKGPAGRADEKLVERILSIASSTWPREFYSCGPTRFMEMVRATLLKSGVNKDSIHEESFGVTSIPTKVPGWTYIGPGSADGTPEKIIATISGETIEVAARSDLSILETLLEAGANPPYSCMSGACMACMAKVEEGQVYQEDPGILVDENIEKNETLTCQAKPLSRVTKVSYDNL